MDVNARENRALHSAPLHIRHRPDICTRCYGLHNSLDCTVSPRTRLCTICKSNRHMAAYCNSWCENCGYPGRLDGLSGHHSNLCPNLAAIAAPPEPINNAANLNLLAQAAPAVAAIAAPVIDDGAALDPVNPPGAFGLPVAPGIPEFDYLAPLDNISWPVINALPTPLVKRNIPSKLFGLYLRVFNNVGEAYTSNDTTTKDRGFKFLFLLPRLLLCSYDILPGGSVKYYRTGVAWTKRFKARLKLLLTYDLNTLLRRTCLHHVLQAADFGDDLLDDVILDQAFRARKQARLQHLRRPPSQSSNLAAAADIGEDADPVAPPVTALPIQTERIVHENVRFNQLSKAHAKLMGSPPVLLPRNRSHLVEAYFPAVPEHQEELQSQIDSMLEAGLEPDSTNDYIFDIPLQANSTSSRLLHQAIKRAPRKTASGIDGWCYEHFRPLLVTRGTTAAAATQGLRHLACLAVMFERGDLPPPVAKYFACAAGFLLAKGNDNYRPLGAPSVIYRLIAQILAKAHAGALLDKLAPLQMAVRLSHGADWMFHSVTDHLLRHPTHSSMSFDFKNAYNTVSRSQILREVKEHCSALLPAAVMILQHDGLVHYQCDDGTIYYQKILEGVRQGDPLSTLFFCLALQPVLQRLTDAHPGLLVKAFADDLCATGPVEICAQSYDTLRHDAASSCNLNLNMTKCYIYSPGSDLTSLDLPALPAAVPRVPCDQGLVLLGAPIGSDTFIASHLRAQLTDLQRHVDRALLLRSVQDTFHILEKCIIPKQTHILRMLPPHATWSFAASFDRCIEDAFDRLCMLPEGTVYHTEHARHQLHLPRREGGLGLLSADLIRTAAFFSSVATTSAIVAHLQADLEHPPPLPFDISSVLAADLDTFAAAAPGFFLPCGLRHDYAEVLGPGLALHLAEALVTLHGQGATADIQADGAFRPCTQDLELPVVTRLDNIPKTQKVMLNEIYHGMRAESFAGLSPHHRARLNSTRGPNASVWLTTLPSKRTYEIPSLEFRVSLTMRLGLPLPASFQPHYTTCLCGATLDKRGLHFQKCKRHAGMRTLRHHNLVSHTRRFLTHTGCTSNVEVSAFKNVVADLSDQDRDKRLDLVTSHNVTHEYYGYDLSITHPENTASLAQAAVTVGAAAKLVDNTKIAKYSDLCATHRQMTFVPLVFETYGAWSPLAVKEVDRLAKVVQDHRGVNKTWFKRHWIRTLSCALIIEVARGHMASLALATNTADPLFSMIRQHSDVRDEDYNPHY